MKRWFWAFALLLSLFIAKPSAAQQRFIVRTTLGLPGLQTVCLLDSCQVLRSLDGTVGQLFVLTTSDLVNPDAFLAVLRLTPGIADAEVDQVLTIVSDLANVATIPPGLSDNTQIDYFGSQVWNGYANQPAASIVRVPDAHTAFGVSGTGIVADIDTGVDPTHPAFANILLPGYDFTRNQAGGLSCRTTPSHHPRLVLLVRQPT